MLLLPFCSFSFSQKSPPGSQRSFRGKHTNLNVKLGGDSVPLKPSGGRKTPELIFVLFFRHLKRGWCNSTIGAKQVVGQTGGGESEGAQDKVRKNRNSNSCDEFLGFSFLFFFFFFFFSNGRFYGRATWGLSMSKFHYIALKNLFDFGLPLLLSSLAILSPGRGGK